MQPTGHEHPPGPGGLQASQLPEGKAGRESPGTLHIQGGWESPSRGAVLEGFVDYFQTTSGAPGVHTCASSQRLRVFALRWPPEVLLPNSWEQSLSRPWKAHRALCAPSLSYKMLQQVLVGPRSLPSDDPEVSFPWET